MKRTNLNNHELINYQDLTTHFFISKTQGKIYQTESMKSNPYTSEFKMKRYKELMIGYNSINPRPLYGQE